MQGQILLRFSDLRQVIFQNKYYLNGRNKKEGKPRINWYKIIVLQNIKQNAHFLLFNLRTQNSHQRHHAFLFKSPLFVANVVNNLANHNHHRN